MEFFDRVAQTEWNKSIQRSLIHWIGLTGEQQVLDAGCGAGHLLMRLAQRAAWVTGIDTSHAMIKKAIANTSENGVANVTLQVGNVRNLPFDDETFDTVVCVDLLFLFDDQKRVLKELLRVCKPTGQVVIVNPAVTMNPWSTKTYCETHRLDEFERDSILAWATASARRTLLTDRQMALLADQCAGELTDSATMLDQLAAVFRIVPVLEEHRGLTEKLSEAENTETVSEHAVRMDSENGNGEGMDSPVSVLEPGPALELVSNAASESTSPQESAANLTMESAKNSRLEPAD